MTWTALLAQGKLKVEATSQREINDLREMVAQNFRDAGVGEISGQGRYEFAYNAARLMATILIRATGHRVGKMGHHFYTFEALKELDMSVAIFATSAIVFDEARAKRNDFSYDTPAPPSETDAEELIEVVKRFMVEAEDWIAEKYPDLARA